MAPRGILIGDTIMSHVSEEQIAGYVANVIARAEAGVVKDHLASCPGCRQTANAYRELVASLQPDRISQPRFNAVWDSLTQRIRLRRFVDQFLADAVWQSEVQRDPRGALEKYQIRPTPELVAALKELPPASGERYGNDLDERISKLLWQTL